MILGVESSCDESSLCLLDPEMGFLKEWTHTQIDLHKLYGGVVPDLASREHLANFPVLLEAIKREGFLKGAGAIDTIAVTCGPGLAGCLALGLAVAKSMALFHRVPVVGINHLRAHAYSPFLPLFQEEPRQWKSKVDSLLPHLGLIVSGGNTLLFVIDPDQGIQVLAETLDDAAGEALDKGAKLLGLPYPGGPWVESAARTGDAERFFFPRSEYSRSRKKGSFFSFSGLKTSLRYQLEKLTDKEVETGMADLCASYQEAVVDQLVEKTRHHLEEGGFAFRSLGLSGGVANNGLLRSRFEQMGRDSSIPCLMAKPEHSGDNASMIAFASLMDSSGVFREDLQLGVMPSLKLEAGSSTHAKRGADPHS